MMPLHGAVQEVWDLWSKSVVRPKLAVTSTCIMLNVTGIIPLTWQCRAKRPLEAHCVVTDRRISQV